MIIFVVTLTYTFNLHTRSFISFFGAMLT